MEPMSRPLVGVSTYIETASWGPWQTTAALIPDWYVDALQAAGCCVALLPPDEQGAEALRRMEGLVLIGGADVDAQIYGEAPHVSADSPRRQRDQSELALYREARRLGMPILGICRGAQLMAIAEGGSLHQHLPEVTDAIHRTAPGTFVEHDADLIPDSLVFDLFGVPRIRVNSSHHQAIRDSGAFGVTGRASDGTAEVIELPGAGFVVGVQWHPEHPDRRKQDAPLFEAFASAAAAYSGVT